MQHSEVYSSSASWASFCSSVISGKKTPKVSSGPTSPIVMASGESSLQQVRDILEDHLTSLAMLEVSELLVSSSFSQSTLCEEKEEGKLEPRAPKHPQTSLPSQKRQQAVVIVMRSHPACARVSLPTCWPQHLPPPQKKREDTASFAPWRSIPLQG